MFTNQLREKIGVMFGNPETTPGGRALKFYASVRLDIRRVETIKTGTESVGNRVRVKVVKNKVAPPFRVAEFDVMYGEGISTEGGLLDVGVAMDVVTKTGAWFTFGETRLGQGREASKEFLKGNTDVAAEIDRRIRAKMTRRRAPGRGHRRGRVAAGRWTCASAAGWLALAHALAGVAFVGGLFGRWIVLGLAERATTSASMRTLAAAAAPFERLVIVGSLVVSCSGSRRRSSQGLPFLGPLQGAPRRLAVRLAAAVPLDPARSSRSCSCPAAGCSRRRMAEAEAARRGDAGTPRGLARPGRARGARLRARRRHRRARPDARQAVLR